jgi:hypothetical protein
MRKITAIIFLFFAFKISAQLNPAFISHLAKERLKREHKTYLLSFPPSDSANFFFAKYCLQYDQPVEFVKSFSSSTRLFNNDTNALNLAGVYMLRQKISMSRSFFYSDFLDYESSRTLHSISGLYHAAINPSIKDSAIIPKKISKEYKALAQFSGKKPFVAGLLSAVIPGAGKAYCGRKLSFLNTFFLHALLVTTSVEAVSRLGWKHPYTVFNLCYAGVFYLANIYGSAKDVKKVKQEKQRQFLNDAADYYQFTGSCALYPAN